MAAFTGEGSPQRLVPDAPAPAVCAGIALQYGCHVTVPGGLFGLLARDLSLPDGNDVFTFDTGRTAGTAGKGAVPQDARERPPVAADAP
jgi:hypothetical protein